MWGNEEGATALFGELVKRLDRANFEVRVFPVWQGDESACRAVARAGGLPADRVDPLLLDSGAFMRYIDRFDVIVTFKLHAAVFAAAAVVPFVAIEYQPKVADFTESIGWDALTFRTDAVDASTIERAVRTVMDDISAYRGRLDSRVDELAQTFRAYARRVEELLLA
jgi:polysaccharide pyruvyl transferase WcaK-like protein